MPTVIYLRGVPGTGKYTTSRILERDLGWPRLWVHHFDAVYRAIGEYRVPGLTNQLIEDVANYLMGKGKDFLVVRPSRSLSAVDGIRALAEAYGYAFLPARLTASYPVLVTRVTRRACGNESPFRLTTKEALDEYLNARPEQPFPGEHVIDTDHLEPEQVAGRIKELLPSICSGCGCDMRYGCDCNPGD